MMCFFLRLYVWFVFPYYACCANITSKICSTVLINASIGLVNSCFVIVIYAQKKMHALSSELLFSW